MPGGEAERRWAVAYEPVPVEDLDKISDAIDHVNQQVIRRLGVSLKLDRSMSSVIIEPIREEGASNVLRAKDIVSALVIGFSPSDAMVLLDEDYVLTIVDVTQAVEGKENHLRRVMGRIIGENGKAKKTIEEITGTRIAINDRRGLVGIIGDYERANIARHAIDLLIQGRMHSTVYRRLEQMMRELKRREVTELWLGGPKGREEGDRKG